MNFPHRSRHIVHNLCSQSFRRGIGSRGENLWPGTCLGETGKGDFSIRKSAHFWNSILRWSPGNNPMILALLADTIRFSRRVIDIQNMLLNIMTIDKRKTKKKKTKHNSKDGQTLSTAPWCGHRRMHALEFSVWSYWGCPGNFGEQGKKRRNIEGNKGARTCFRERGNKKNLYKFSLKGDGDGEGRG